MFRIYKMFFETDFLLYLKKVPFFEEKYFKLATNGQIRSIHIH
jgi:hypothetical protein